MADSHTMKTLVLPVDARKIGDLRAIPQSDGLLDDFEVELDDQSIDAQHIRLAAQQLRTSDTPVAFPTETVYGLGADATRSEAVQGIYRAKQRPSDNPLIVHFASLKQLRTVLQPGRPTANGTKANGHVRGLDPIPPIYHPLIEKFWPGPLTIILPNPSNSVLAPEVTAGLSTFGARIPANIIALALMKLADVLVAAPSANASTKPSPTAAEHVAYDLEGRIETIIDGGPCSVGVESTVVDGLSNPPLILRPGGISAEQLCSCAGWENVQIGYANVAETGGQPRAPGMKYRHYAPKAVVILVEPDAIPPTSDEIRQYLGSSRRVGVIRTRQWAIDAENAHTPITLHGRKGSQLKPIPHEHRGSGFAGLLATLQATPEAKKAIVSHRLRSDDSSFEVLDLSLGPDTAGIARGIFAALRELDRQDVDAILVEGMDDAEGETAAAIMNRLRKAAEVRVAV